MDLLCNDDDDDDDDGGVAVAMQQGITGERSRHMANKKPGIIESKSMNKNLIRLFFYSITIPIIYLKVITFS